MTFYPPPGGTNPFQHPQPVQVEEFPGGRRRDPGSSKAARIAWVLVAVLMSVLVISNQLFPPEAPKKVESAAGTVTPPDPADPFTLQAKLTASMKWLYSASPGETRKAADTLGGYAKTDEERVRAAIVAADLVPGDEGRALAAKVLSEVTTTNPALKRDIEILKTAHESGGAIADAADKQRIIDHHGWFGKLAVTYGKADTDPERAALLDISRLILALGLVGFVLLVAVVGGITAFIIMMVQISQGKITRAFEPPAPGGSVYLEAFPFFIAGFLLLHFGFDLYATHVGAVSEKIVMTQLAAQWVLALFPLYPVLFRKVPFSQWRRDVGWHSGRGFWREVGAGIYGYFAGLPLLFLAMALTLGMVLLKGLFWKMNNPQGQEPPLPYNPVAELMSKGSPGILILFFLLATMWAPLVEETMLRGCLYRHLRSRLPMFGAAVVSALFFGFMHGYNVLLLMPVITIGFTFALMREWRGSLIATMTGHFLHNFTTVGIVLTLMSALKG